MVGEKTGRAMQEKERERKEKNGKIIKVAGCSTPSSEGVLLIRPDTTLADVRKFGEVSRRWASLRYKFPAERRALAEQRS